MLKPAGGLAFRARAIAACVSAAAVWPRAAAAHVGGGAFILLLPTHLYVAGGAIVVAASFALVALVPSRNFSRIEALSLRWSVPAFPWRGTVSTAASLLSLAAILLLATAGVLGSRDPLANPLPLFVWTVWWIGSPTCTRSSATSGTSEPLDRPLPAPEHGRAVSPTA